MKNKIITCVILLLLLGYTSCVPLPSTRAENEARIRTKIPRCMNFMEVGVHQIVVDSNYNIYDVQLYTNGDVIIQDSVKK